MKILAASLALLLTACSAALPLAQGDVRAPFIAQYQVTAADGTDSLVVSEYRGGDRWRWLQTSPLGAPLARQLYENGRWRNDGFLPPNRAATALFTALMLRENPAAFPQVRHDGDTYRFRGQRWLQEATRDATHELTTPAGRWRVKALAP